MLIFIGHNSFQTNWREGKYCTFHIATFKSLHVPG